MLKGGAQKSKVIVWFENQAFHSMPSYMHEFYSLFSRCALGGNPKLCEAPGRPTYRIFNHPISLSDQRISYDSIVQKVADIGISLTILCAFSFIPAGFVVYIVRERVTQEKRLQFVCGVRPLLYWLSAFLWDFFYFMLIVMLTLAVIAAFGVTAYTANARNFASLLTLLVLFGWSSLPMSYVFSSFFSDTGSAYMITFCFTLFSGIATCISVFLLSFIAAANPAVVNTYQVLDKLSLFFPSYSLGSGLIELTKNQILADAYAIFGIYDVYKDPFSLTMLGQKYISLALTGALFFLIIIIMESRINFFPCCKPKLEAIQLIQGFCKVNTF